MIMGSHELHKAKMKSIIQSFKTQKMKIRISLFIFIFMLAATFSAQNQQPPGNNLLTPTGNAETHCSSMKGKPDKGYDFENWTSSGIKGTACMTTHGKAAAFQSEWDITGYGFVHQCGKNFIRIPVDSVNTNASANYVHSISSGRGAGHTGVYGWLLNPLIEYYIVDNWFGHRHKTDTYKGRIHVDGGTYDVYWEQRSNAPNYTGKNADFVQWWSVRTSPRDSGTISIAKHFQAWRNLGMSNGELQNVVFYVEPDVWHNGAFSQGTINYTTATINLSGGKSEASPTP
jgi:endo-1,4-beta-xylanase